METHSNANNDFIAVVAEEDGVTIIGLTSGRDTKFHHTEKLDKGEAFICQFTDVTTAVKIRGKAKVLTGIGALKTGGDPQILYKAEK